MLANALTVEDFEAACEEARRLGLDPDELVDFDPPGERNAESDRKWAELIQRLKTPAGR